MLDPFDFPDRDLVDLYSTTFKTPAGRLVLIDILNDLGFFSMCIDGAEDQAMSNYAKKLLWKLGRFNAKNLGELTEAILSVPGYSREVIEDINNSNRMED